MVFKCQEDSFLTEYTTKVISCESTDNETAATLIANGGKPSPQTNGRYAVILEDTILFPEGGGQPSDRGCLNDQKVLQVVRKGEHAVHYVDRPLDVGTIVRQTIDWDRRLDHMQQHSGQHLITAIVDREFKLPTISWWLGEDVSYVELDTVDVIAPARIAAAERICNELIRAGREVSVQVYGEDTPEDVLKEARSARGLPLDHKGDIRVVKIEGVESNMCCGTHVTNLSQLQVVKLLHSENKKSKGNKNKTTLLYFLVGNRVINRLHASIEREQKLVGLLKGGPADHVDLVDKLQKNVKQLNKNLQSALKELITFEVDKLQRLSPPVRYYCLHRSEADADHMNHFVRQLNRTDVFLFLSIGDERKGGSGSILLYGEEKDVAELGPKISALLNGKGAGKGNKYQAKCTNMGNRSEAEQLIKSHFI